MLIFRKQQLWKIKYCNVVVTESTKVQKKTFVGAAEELCGSTSGKGGVSRSSNQGWWTGVVADAVREKKET